MKDYKLNNNDTIPVIGFGTYKVPNEKLENCIKTAYDCGYRLFDTAQMYNNEIEVGKALKNYDRKSFFLTTKVWPSDIINNNIEDSLDQSLKNLQTDYLDLFLLHWPVNELISYEFNKLNRSAWEVMIKLMESGKTKAIGVSNFTPKYLQPIMDSLVIPAVNQIEFHPGYLQKDTVNFCQDNGILVQAWSPLARGRVDNTPILEQLAEKYNKSISQIILRFIIQEKVIPIPKATSKEHIKDNIEVFDFELTESEVNEIYNLPEMGHSGYHPDTFTL